MRLELDLFIVGQEINERKSVSLRICYIQNPKSVIFIFFTLFQMNEKF